MKADTSEQMTDEEINVAIYEALGATWWVSGGGFHYLGFKPANDMFRPCDRPVHFDSIALRDVPRYTSDHNAMNEAETVAEMHHNQRWAESIVGVALMASTHTYERTNGWDWVLLVSRLSARQRAEAFLRTIVKWRES